MPQTRTSCPRCHQPIMAEINQLFDTNIDPQAKQKILSGQFNIANCPNCGFKGTLSTPLVYHDPEKELLLTFFPPELGLPVNEQEKLIGPLINQAVNKLPIGKKKSLHFTTANHVYDAGNDRKDFRERWYHQRNDPESGKEDRLNSGIDDLA